MRDHRQQQEDQHTKRQKTLVAILPFAARGCQTLMVCCCFLCVSLYVIVVVVVVVNVVVCSCLFLFSIFAHETVLLTYQVSYIYIYLVHAHQRYPPHPAHPGCPVSAHVVCSSALYDRSALLWVPGFRPQPLHGYSTYASN